MSPHPPFFLIPLTVALLSEIAKVVLHGIRTGNWDEKLFQSGGMPSSHSAFVTALLIVVERAVGMESIEFAIAFTFAAIIWYDAFHSRRSIGEQAEILNHIQRWKRIKVNLGHTFKEVLGGILFGAVVTWAGMQMFGGW